jgi:hypothetical protein
MLGRCVRVVLILMLPMVAALGTGASASAARRGCVVAINQFAFHPSTAAEGEAVVLRLVLTNCTSQVQTVTLTQFGTEPPGCPVIDPLARSVTIKAHGAYRSNGHLTAPPCAGTEAITLRVSKNGKQLASQTAHLTVT